MRISSLCALGIIFLVSCKEHSPAPSPSPRTFLFVSRYLDPPQSLVVRTSTPEVIQVVLQELALPEESRRKILAGKIARGRKEYNGTWSWHMKEGEWRLVDNSIELCDGRPSDVEADVDYWIDKVGSFCPWSLYVKEERVLP